MRLNLLAGGFALVLGLAGVLWVARFAQSSTPQFRGADEAQTFFALKGFHCTMSGSTSSMLAFNFFVSDRPLTQNDIDQLVCRRKCGLTEAWRGIVWVSDIESNDSRLNLATIDGKYRCWGNVLVAGDEGLMDRMESHYKNR